MQYNQFLKFLREQERSKLTIQTYARDLEIFIEWFKQETGRIPEPDTVTPLDIRDFKGQLETMELKPATINRKLSALRSYFKWAQQVKFTAINPMIGIRDKPQSQQAPRWLERKGCHALIRAAEERVQLADSKRIPVKMTATAREARRDAAILALFLHAGLRLAELCNLYQDDLSFGERKGSATIRSGKGGKWRQVPLNRDVRRELKRWLNVKPDIDQSHLFVGRRSRTLGPRGVRHVIERLAKHADISEVSPHVLRHTFAKNLIDAGTSLDRVATLLGHSNLNITRRYITPSQADLAREVERIAWSDKQ